VPTSALAVFDVIDVMIADQRRGPGQASSSRGVAEMNG
jgi:hypothetical protein